MWAVTMKKINIDKDLTPDDTNGVVLDTGENVVYVGKGMAKDNVGNLMELANIPDDWVMSENNEGRSEPACINIKNLGE